MDILSRFVDLVRKEGLFTAISQSWDYASSEINRINELPYWMYGLYYRTTQPSPIKIMDESWDNLIILDACRYDIFAEECTLNGTLSRVLSPASWSMGYLQAEFGDQSFYDTVYVTANPYFPHVADETFHATIPLFDQWNLDYKTILPSDVTAAACDAAEMYPNKRLIIHYMQPHTPYIGKKGRQIASIIDTGGINFTHSDDGLKKIHEDLDPMATPSIWDVVADSSTEISERDLRKAYRENLQIVLNEVNILLDSITGQTVVTADHGEHLGERLLPFGSKLYGHSLHAPTPQLREIPWLKIDGGRRRIVSDPPESSPEFNPEEIEQRLVDLGYR